MPVFLSGSLLLTGSICTSQGITGATIYGVTAACAPTVFGTTAVCGPTIFGSTAVCSPTVFGTTAVCSPTVFGTTRVCSANLCATTTICGPSFVGGTMSGTTLYGSTVICGASICTTGNICAAGSITGSAILSTGRITAQTLVVSTISSSVTFSSGSNIFGNNPANRQTFTGSLNVSGSGNHFILGANVGIGTALPSEALHISSSGTSPRPALFLETSNASATPEVRLFQTSGRSVLMNLQTNGDWSFQNSTNNSTYNERFRISSAGTASFTANALANSADAATINLKQNSTTANTGIYLERSGEQKGYYIYIGGSTDNLTFQRNNAGTKADVMSLTRDGCVLIGTACTRSTLTIKSINDEGIVITRPSDATSSHLKISTTETGGDAYTVKYNTFNNEMIFNTYSGGGTGGNIIFRTTCVGAGSESERLRINCHGIACFACQVCAPQLRISGIIGNGSSNQNARLVKTGATSVVFTIAIPNEANWNPGYATIRVAGSRTGLEEQYAAMYFLRLTYYGGSGVSAAVNNVSGDTSAACISVTANTCTPQVVTITVCDAGTSTNYLIADIDASFNTGIGSIS